MFKGEGEAIGIKIVNKHGGESLEKDRHREGSSALLVPYLEPGDHLTTGNHKSIENIFGDVRFTHRIWEFMERDSYVVQEGQVVEGNGDA